MFENKRESDDEKIMTKNYSGKIAIAIYFKGYGDNFANDCRRFLGQEIVDQFKKELGTEFETILFLPNEYHLIRYIPIKDKIDVESPKSTNRIVGRAKGGFEIYEISGLNEEMINVLKLLLNKGKQANNWFNFFRIYRIEEVI
jgi:hypothetical protein